MSLGTGTCHKVGNERSMEQQGHKTGLTYRTKTMRLAPFVFNGKKKDYESGFHYYGARYYWSEVLTGWLSVDPMADKYPSISPYAYCAWNSVKLVDPDGRELVIVGRKGNATTYTPNMSGEGLDRFTRTAVNALNAIYKTVVGKSLIDDLCNSSNTFKIAKSSESKFERDDGRENTLKAYKEQFKTDPMYSDIYNAEQDKSKFEGGSGGTIYWKSSGTIIPTTKGGTVNDIIDLSHEMFHAKDANHGMLDDRIENGIRRDEWQAVYNENILRGQMGLPLHTHYKSRQDDNGLYLGGAGPSMLNEGQPIKPWWL